MGMSEKQRMLYSSISSRVEHVLVLETRCWDEYHVMLSAAARPESNNSDEGSTGYHQSIGAFSRISLVPFPSLIDSWSSECPHCCPVDLDLLLTYHQLTRYGLVGQCASAHCRVVGSGRLRQSSSTSERPFTSSPERSSRLVSCIQIHLTVKSAADFIAFES